MASRDYSFIDIAVLDDVRARFAAGDALVILSIGLDEVIWTNGPGAALLGHADIASAIDAPVSLPAAARRQIMATSNYPRIGRDRSVAVRLASGMTSRTIGFLASSIILPDGEDAILLSVPGITGGARPSSAIAERAISGLDEPSSFVALLDEAGKVAAASAGFDRLGISPQTLDGLAVAARDADDRLVKRLVPVDGGSLPMGIARLVDTPATYLLVVVDETGDDDLDNRADQAPRQADETNRKKPVPENTAEEIARDRDETVDADIPRDPLAADTTPELADPGLPSSRNPDAPSSDYVPSTDGRSSSATAPESRAPAEHDGWYFNAGETPATSLAGDANDNPTGDHPTGDEYLDASAPSGFVAPPVDRASTPVRFVWRTDAGGHFSTISEEFAQAVGASAASVIGRSFRDVAEAFGLDPSHEIATLLERRDTWSGRSVLWPVAGTDLRIPVDLAALPVYGRDRNFEGFRGFGVARAGDAVVDPDALGLKLGEAPASTEKEQPMQAAPVDDPFQGEIPALAIVPKPDRRHSDKVIKLAEHRPTILDKGLTQGERTAFREIGDRLKKDGAAPNADNDRAAAKPIVPSADGGTSRPTSPGERPEEVMPPAETGGTAENPGDGDTDDLDELAGQIFGRGSIVAPEGHDEDHALSSTLAIQPTDAETDPISDDPVNSGPEAQPIRVRDAGPGDATIDAENETSGERGAEEGITAGGADGDTLNAAASQPSDSGDDTATTREGLPAETIHAATPEASDEAIQGPAPSLASIEPSAAAPRAEASSPSIPASGFLPSAFAERDRHAAVDTSILDKLPIPVLIHSGDALHYANREFFEFTAYDSIEDLADRGGIGELFAEPFIEDGPAADRKLRLRRGDGLEFPVEAFLQSVRWGGGKALMLALKRVSRAPIQPQPGLTGPERAELEARVAEMRTIIDTATDGVVLIGRDGAILSISRPAEALFGFDSGEVAGKPFTSLFAIESQRAARDYLGGLSDNGVASVLNDGREVIGREAQGRFIPLFMTIGKLPGDSGYCAVVRDITQWKRAEEELTQSRAQAERASSQKTDFLARVSHEIRTPLNAIIGFSELMIDEKFGPIGNDRYRDYLRDINRSGNHVLDLVNDLLDISKIEAGEQEMAYEAVSLNDTPSETVAMMQPQANRERVIIRSSFASRLPEVVADLRSVRQIALNLLSNAVRYTQAGGQVIVSTSYEASGDIVMRVRDTGIGMTHAEIEQALKPFKQINALKRGRGDGTGLGLPLTKAMVEANRAKFAITSSPGEGTLVEVTFPSTRVLAD